MKQKQVYTWFLYAALLACSASLGSLHAQESIAITVYNANIALVHETRTIEVPRGLARVDFGNVAAQIDPTSVQIRLLTDPQSCRIREQNYEYDLINSDKIFQKYLEQPLSFATKSSGPVQGELLSIQGGQAVLRKPDGTLLVLNLTDVLSTSFPELPEGLRTRPTLVWLTDNNGATRRAVEVSYLTRGMGWHAEYVGVLDANDATLKVNGWVSIDNKSGATYKDAKLKLVAGDINLVEKRRPPILGRAEQFAEASAPDFQEKSFFEYHLYTLQRPTTLRENQIKQITFIPESEATITKRYVYDPQRDARNVGILVEFRNSTESGLGMPLPAGKVRLYKADEDGALLFLGEDIIEHTPRNEDIRLTIGKAFDIIVDRQRVREQVLGRRSREQNFEVRVRNHKPEPITVTVIDRFYGDWEIRQTSHTPVKKTAERVEWELPVAAESETLLTYAVLLRW